MEAHNNVITEIKQIDPEGILEQCEGLDMKHLGELYRGFQAKRKPVSQYDKDLKAVLDGIQDLILVKLKETGMEKVTYEGIGTIFATTTKRFSIEDPEKFYAFVHGEIQESVDTMGTPVAGFSFLNKSLTQSAVRDLLTERAEDYLSTNPFPEGSLEAYLPYEDQVEEVMRREAAKIGVSIFNQEKASIRK